MATIEDPTTTTTTLPPNFLDYVPGRIQVFVNGRKLRNDEFTATDGRSVTLAVPAEADDVVTIAELDIIPVANPSDYYYVFLGYSLPWDDDNTPPTPEDTRVFDAETKRNMMAVKLIRPSDTSLMVPRIDWTLDNVYVPYDSGAEVSGTQFYVLNSTQPKRIYKCIYTPGVKSEIEPTHTTAGPKVLADEYIWEFIYEVPEADEYKFMTTDYIPVKFYSTSSTFDHTGLLDYITVETPGQDYLATPAVYLLGDGNGATAEAVTDGNQITAINVTDGGSGYSYMTVLIVASDYGAGCTATAVLRASDLPVVINQDVASYALTTAGAINTIEVTNPGTSYVDDGSTGVTITGDGTGATAFPPTIIDGTVYSIEVDQQGSGYTFADVTISSTVGAAAGATARAIIEPQGGHGSNIPQELFSTVVGISVNIEDIVSDFFTGNDFRQIGVITNPRKYDGFEHFTDATGNACYIATVSDPDKYTVDDILTTDDGGQFIVSNKYIDPIGYNYIHLLPVIDLISVNSTITNVTTAQNDLLLDALVPPEVSTALGNIIYVKNVSPVERTAGQAEQLKLYFSF